jgi:hypothetical protein
MGSTVDEDFSKKDPKLLNCSKASANMQGST